MKQNKSKPTRSKPARHNGAAGNDHNHRKIYQVCFTYEQWGCRFIEAASAEDARNRGRRIQTVEPGFWKDLPEHFTVLEVEAVQSKAMPKDAAILPIPD